MNYFRSEQDFYLAWTTNLSLLDASGAGLVLGLGLTARLLHSFIKLRSQHSAPFCRHCKIQIKFIQAQHTHAFS